MKILTSIQQRKQCGQSIIKGSGIITSTSFNRIWLLPCSYQVGRSAHLIGVRYEFDMNKVAMKTESGTT